MPINGARAIEYYGAPAARSVGEAEIVARTATICAELPRYGSRRVTAQHRRDGLIVNHK